jgi:glycerol-3-phosphate O-acyltransferase 1/2
LSVIIDAQTEKVIEDALLVPVSINYERLVDGNFIREQLGQSKIMESFTNACRAIWKMLNAKYGVMRVDFSQPFSVKVSSVYHSLIYSPSVLAYLII